MITCITATYKRPKELARAIRSVNKQTYKDWEHIIVYDGKADDKTKAVIEKYKDKRRRFIELDEHTGKDSKPKNTAIKEAKGDYLCYLDDDNEYMPNFMETLLFEIEIGDEDVVYGDMRMFDKGDKEGKPAIKMDYDAQFLLNRCYIDSGMVLHKKQAVIDIGGWNEDLPRFKDWNLWVRMSKMGLRFRHIPVYLTKYHITKGNSAEQHPVRMWDSPDTGMTMFDPTWWNPSSCPIWGEWLGTKEPQPKVAIFTLTHNRRDYTQRTIESLGNSTKYPFDWFIFDNGSVDEGNEDNAFMVQGFTPFAWVRKSPDNKGITHGSNACLDAIFAKKRKKGHTDNKDGGYTVSQAEPKEYDIIIKMDNDVEFLTKGWLEDFIDMWKRNRKLYIGPYPEGLVDSPGGAPRVGVATIGDEFVEVTHHVSGLLSFIDASAYKDFRWSDQFLHGNQDVEFSNYVREQGYMPCILSRHRVQHMDGTVGQQKKKPEYFKERVKQKTTTYEDSSGTTE